MCSQIELRLDGIAANDHLTWIRDPEPPSLGRELRSIAARPDPLGDRIQVALCWRGSTPEPRTAAAWAGFALIPEVLAVGQPRCALEGRDKTGKFAGDVPDASWGRESDLANEQLPLADRRTTCTPPSTERSPRPGLTSCAEQPSSQLAGRVGGTAKVHPGVIAAHGTSALLVPRVVGLH